MYLPLILCCLFSYVVGDFDKRGSDRKVGCATIITECSGTTSCNNIYTNYTLHCHAIFSQSSEICSSECKSSFRLLLKQPQLRHLRQCDCQENRKCIWQKCTLMKFCLSETCQEGYIPEITQMRTVYGPTTYVTSSEGMTTFAGNTQTNDKFQKSCEEVVILCKDNDECMLLLDKRHDQCLGYKASVETCSSYCISANTALMMNPVGRYLWTCRFRSQSYSVMRLRGLGTDCIDRTSTLTTTPFTVERGNSLPTAPTMTKHCTTLQSMCKTDSACSGIYNNFTDTCSLTIIGRRKCSIQCRHSITLLEGNMLGTRMLNCNCNTALNPAQCKDRRDNLMRSCRSDIVFSTDSYSVPPSTESIAVNLADTKLESSHIIIDKVDCNGREMLVTLSIDPGRGQPDITASDPSCRAEYRTGNIMQLRLPERGCGTVINQTAPGKYVYTNKLQITQVGGRRNRFTKQISCTKDMLMQQRQIVMSFYKDANFAESFKIYPQTIQSTEHVYVELKGHEAVSLFVEECTATPTNSRNHKSSLMYQFLQNGCKTDFSSNLKFYDTPANNTKRFSLKAFGFQGHGEVFMHCELALCYNGESACDQRCNTKKTSTDKISVYQGPYVYNAVSASAESALFSTHRVVLAVGVLVAWLW